MIFFHISWMPHRKAALFTIHDCLPENVLVLLPKRTSHCFPRMAPVGPYVGYELLSRHLAMEALYSELVVHFVLPVEMFQLL